ncbi:hypothetical protein EGW08_018101 [Elysia chlorotica]|uniref:Peroxidase n=1 Tax=Elysia chlorotica TaxID=188477 RepID=A0A3S0ZG89_ELYCH|nr:hypothetical protein EGW08_018101 [Elysia chlorotica]
MRFFVFSLLIVLVYVSYQATAAQKIATPAKVDGRFCGQVTFSENEHLSRDKRQERRRGPWRRPPSPPPQAVTKPKEVPTTPSAQEPTTSTTAAAPKTVLRSASTATDTTSAETDASITCDSDLYRSADGSCNNKANPFWGSRDSAFLRTLEPVYTEANDVFGPVLASTVDGYALPSPRLISRIVHDPDDFPDRRPVMNMQWGQFLDHDITSTPVNPSTETCCYDGIVASGVAQHPQVAKNGPCFPILIPAGDNHFTTLETRCMEFKRSYQTMVNGKPEQINLNTAFVDGSQIYGSTEEEMDELRSSALGRGRLLDINDNLPKNTDDVCVVSNSTTDYCLRAGDSRVNVYPGLGALHTVFLRMHNRIADGLAAQNKSLTDEEVFQKARRIVGALLQKITYSEWLPTVVGPDAATTYRLASTVPYAYEPDTNPTLHSVFSTAAFRYGHSQVTDTLTINNVAIESVNLFNNPHHVLHSIDSLLAGILGNPGQRVDRWYSDGMTNHVFETVPFKGLDIVSLNIQRGRDHGLPRYNQWRKECGLDPITSFDDMGRHGRPFQRVYRNTDDIDLYSGALHEAPVHLGVVGDTYACLISRQFEKLKFGDRFWYQNPDAPKAFTSAQIKEIEKQSLATIICQTTGLESVQSNAFMNVARNNRLVYCSYVKPINYSLF